MMPAAAIAWIIGGALSRMKRRTAGILFALFVALAAPAIVLSGRMYRSEARFWERIYRAAPANSFLAYKFGQTFFLRGEYLKAETLLNRALRFPMKRETAVSISLLQSRIDWQRGDFESALRWLNRIGAFPLRPQQELAVLDMKASIFLARDQTIQAERLLEEGIARFGKKRTVRQTLRPLYRAFPLASGAGAGETNRPPLPRSPWPPERRRNGIGFPVAHSGTEESHSSSGTGTTIPPSKS